MAELKKPKTKNPEKKKIAKESKPISDSNQKIAIIRVRGIIGVNYQIQDTMHMLKLYYGNMMTVVDDTPSRRGMITKIKDYTTWGEIDAETLKLVIEKRGEKDPKDPSKLKKFFRLSPPRKGYAKKSIKVPFSTGGALGYRGKAINDLIKRML